MPVARTPYDMEATMLLKSADLKKLKEGDRVYKVNGEFWTVGEANDEEMAFGGPNEGESMLIVNFARYDESPGFFSEDPTKK